MLWTSLALLSFVTLMPLTLAPISESAAADTPPEQRLAEAIRKRDLVEIKRALDDGASAFTSVSWIGSARDLAVALGDVKVVRCMIDNGVAFKDAPRSPSGWSDLEMVLRTEQADPELVKLLLSFTPNIRAANAADASDPKRPGSLLSMPGARASAAITKMLIDAGADINEREKGGTGYSVLESAIYYSHTDVIKLLLEAGAKTDARDNGPTVWHALARRKAQGDCPEIAKLLKPRTTSSASTVVRGYSPLLLAVHGQNAPAVAALIEAGASPEETDGGGQPMLIAAICFSDHATIKALLDHKANPNTPDKHGRTPLAWLLSAADPVKRVSWTRTRRSGTEAPLTTPSVWQQVDNLDPARTLKALLDAGANPIIDVDGWNALDLAVGLWDESASARERASELMLSDPEALRVHSAFCRSHDPTPIVAMLIDAGVKRAVGREGIDALDLAITRLDTRRDAIIRELARAKTEPAKPRPPRPGNTPSRQSLPPEPGF